MCSFLRTYLYIKNIYLYMPRKVQSKYHINDKIVYHANTHLGWSIVIMPDNVLIDNYHTNIAHIHPNPKKHFIKNNLNEQDQYKILEIVLLHLDVNNGLILELLEEEVNDYHTN